jgi:hypothetical protein
MTSSVASPQPAAPVAPPSRSRLPMRIAALTPLWLFLIAQLLPGGFSRPLFSKPPEMIGLPFGVILGALATGWMLLGLVLVWNSRSRLTDLLALVVFTVPATLFVIFGPAVILIMQNLS